MAPVLPAALAAGVAAASGTTLFGLTVASSAVLIGVGNLALGFVSRALAPKPSRRRGLAGEQGLTQMVRLSAAPRRLIWGTRQVSGVLAFAATTGTDNRFLHLVVALAGHRVEALADLRFNDEVVGTRDANGTVIDGRWALNPAFPQQSVVVVKEHLGDDDQAADAFMVDNIAEWTSAHRLRGVAYLYLRLTFQPGSGRDVWPNGIPNVKVTVRGRRLWDPRAATVAITSSAVGNPATLTTATAHGLKAGDRVFITGHSGATPALKGEYQVLSAPTGTTFTVDESVSAAGSGGALAVMAWSDNAALATLDYLVAADGLGADPDTEIDVAAAIAAANICDEDVSLSAATPTFTVAAEAATDTLTQSVAGGRSRSRCTSATASR